MPLPLTVSCFNKIQMGFTYLVPAHLGSPGKRAVKRVCVYGPVTIEWWGVGVVICLERGADCLHMIKLMPLPSQNPTISCLIKTQNGFTCLVLVNPGCPVKRSLNGCLGWVSRAQTTLPIISANFSIGIPTMTVILTITEILDIHTMTKQLNWLNRSAQRLHIQTRKQIGLDLVSTMHGMEQGGMSRSTKNRSFRRRSTQPISWLGTEKKTKPNTTN